MWSLLWLRLTIVLLIWPSPITSLPMGAKVTAMWSGLGQWATSPSDNYTQYTFRYKTFDLVRLAAMKDHYAEAESKCASTNTRLPRFEDLAGDLFQRLIFNNNNFIRVSVTKQYLTSDPSDPTGLKRIHQWTMEQGRFFLESPESRVKRLVELDQNSLTTQLVDSDRMEINEKSPSLILCIQERQLPRPTPPPQPQTPPMPPQSPRPSLTDVACACSGGGRQSLGIAGPSGYSAGDFPWPLACVAFLGVMCICLASALLIVCRAQRKSAAAAAMSVMSTNGGAGSAGHHPLGAAKNGNSIPRTTSSLMEFNGHHQGHHHPSEKAHSLAAQTMPRRPRVIHHGQIHTNGYLTLGSIQARKQREMQREIGLSEPPSPNHSIARSDYQHGGGTMSVR